MNKKGLFYFLFAWCLIFSLVTLYKLFELKVLKADELKNNFKNKVTLIPPLRGSIYLTDKNNNLIPIAYSVYVYDLYYYPPKAKNISEELTKIAKILNSDLNLYLQKITDPQKAVILEKNISESLKSRIENLKLDSVFFEQKVERKYPLGDLLSTILGFAVYDDEQKITKGLYGLEKYYDEYLRGEPGFLTKFGDYKPPTKGADLVLNIDYYLQLKLDKILEKALENYKAEGGLIIVVESQTGKILGVSEKPGFDLNSYSKVKDYQRYLSRLSLTYEPGSVMKPFFYAGAFEEKLITPTSTYFDQGYVVLNNRVIYNFDKKGRGEVDFKTALEQSLNTGSVYVSQLLGKNKFLKYIKKFNFDKRPDIDFPILVENNLKTLYPPYGREINFGTASFGQGISLSPLSLIHAYQVFANDGKMTNLRLVKSLIYPTGEEINNESKVINDDVISTSTNNLIKEILEGVVQNQAKKAKILGYRIGGKTGSAEIPEKGGYSDEVITTFVGILPLSKPRFIVLVRLDKPEKSLLSFGTAVPTFRLVAEFLINYYNLEPDNPEELTH